jgi:hypothetical protein
MIRMRVSFSFVVLGLLVGSLLAADDPTPDQPEPPLRLKKKVKPEPAPSRRTEPAPKNEPAPKEKPPPSKHKDAPESSLEDLQEKIREITNRVSKNMSQVEGRLHKRDPGEKTQQTQLDIVRDLDQLIEQTKRQQQQQQSQSSSLSSPSQGSNQSRGQQSQPGSQGGSFPQPRQAGIPSGNTGREGKNRQEGANKIADLYKDVWGHLPESLRQEMNQYAREQFMAKYNDLLKQYYATIAEKGRRNSVYEKGSDPLPVEGLRR